MSEDLKAFKRVRIAVANINKAFSALGAAVTKVTKQMEQTAELFKGDDENDTNKA